MCQAREVQGSANGRRYTSGTKRASAQKSAHPCGWALSSKSCRADQDARDLSTSALRHGLGTTTANIRAAAIKNTRSNGPQPPPAVPRLVDIAGRRDIGGGGGFRSFRQKRRTDVRLLSLCLLSLSRIYPSQPLAIIRARIGLRTNSAIATTAMFMIAVSRNTRCQLPVDVLIMLATGTRKAEVPFAV